jgi:hypothetical protein
VVAAKTELIQGTIPRSELNLSPLRVKLRRTQCEQMFSAVPPIADILGFELHGNETSPFSIP